MEKAFVIGDIHGNFDLLTQLLEKWRPQEEHLIFLGDYIDRGPQSLQVLEKVKSLVENGATALIGNHEQLFLHWLNFPKTDSYMFVNVGGASTIQSFQKPEWVQKSIEEIAALIQVEYASLLEWIKTLPRFMQWGEYFFVHAGIDPHVEQATETNPEDFLWIRDEFLHFPHKAKETVVFGHTQTQKLNVDGSGDVWISPCHKKIGIDGGVILEGGQLNGIVLTKGSNEMLIHIASENGVSTRIRKIK
ncbi:metallophosphoesterase family protein [Solibacillus sp. CAU 1738]|uniref:metallophosphoesterase family protein n=1 Tax=Solibacillus sp. CAU 1738 TaxID=3140363 RepID=UPI0032602D92